MKSLVMALFALLAATAALAEGDASPPASPAAQRMQELHRILYDTRTTAEERRAAREELLRLLRSNEAKVPPRQMPPHYSCPIPTDPQQPYPDQHCYFRYTPESALLPQ